jgi:hypothetical protein
MRRMTVNQGSRSDYDWDEYSSEFEDDYEDDYDEMPSTHVASTAVASVAATTETAEEETDWVMGSDGYWWYHDKEANEWWYKDANGDIVKHP